MSDSQRAILPFNGFIFRALYEWMVAMDLDPILVVNESNSGDFSGRFVYIGPKSVRDVKFDLSGFQCLASRGGRPFVFKVDWNKVRGLIIGDEASIENIRGEMVIHWCDDHWELNLPKLCSPDEIKTRRKIKIITKDKS